MDMDINVTLNKVWESIWSNQLTCPHVLFVSGLLEEAWNKPI